MPDHDTIRDFHDELLSAYLDGELSAEERARVEERLAVDPVARQTLEELRGVSQAVRNLPHLPLHEDLLPGILQRAEQATRVTSSAPAASPVLPASAGSKAGARVGSRRYRIGWVAAALGTAAALLVIFLQGDSQPPPQVAGVAGRDESGSQAEFRELREGSRFRARGQSDPATGVVISDGRESSLASQLKSGETSPATPTPSKDVSTVVIGDTWRGEAREAEVAQQVAQGERYNRTIDGVDDAQSSLRIGGGDSDTVVRYGEPAGATSQPATLSNAGAKAEDGQPPTSSVAAGRGAAAVNQRPESVSGVEPQPASGSAAPSVSIAAKADGILIVHLGVTLDALRNRTFDRQITSHQIAFEPTGETEFRSFGGGRDGYLFDSGLQLNRADRLAMEAQELDAILVEAPVEQIAALIAGLDADSENVTTITVDDGQLNDEEKKTANLAAVDWGKFGRVSVPDELLKWQRGRENADLRSAGPAGTSSQLTTEGLAQAGNGRGRARGGRGAARGGGGRGGRVAARPRGAEESAESAGARREFSTAGGADMGGQATSARNRFDQTPATQPGAAGDNAEDARGERVSSAASEASFGFQPSIGRAMRVDVSRQLSTSADPKSRRMSQTNGQTLGGNPVAGQPQSTLGRGISNATSTPSTEPESYYLKTDAPRAPAGGLASASAGKPTDTAAAELELAKQQASSDSTRAGVPNFGQMGGQSQQGATPSLVNAPVGGEAQSAKRPERLRVLFVLHANPGPAAAPSGAAPAATAPTAAAPATPATSPPPADRAK